MNAPLSGWAPFEEWRKHVPEPADADRGGTRAKPFTYAGTTFRSTLEANWACTLDHYQIAWEYEPRQIILASGKAYVPDFMLPDLKTVIEVKGPDFSRLEKTAEYAREILSEGWIVLVGFTPARRSVTPYTWQLYLQWNDAAGYDTRLARCHDCDAWHWLRPRLSLNCPRCGTSCRGLLATSGEMHFKTAAERVTTFTDILSQRAGAR